MCVCEDVEGHGPRIRSGPEAPPTYRRKVPSEFLVDTESPRTLGDVDHAPLPESQGRPHVCTGTNPRNLYRSVASAFREKVFFRMLLLAMWPEAKLLRCPRGQRNIFEERSTVCVCVCEDVEGHGPLIRSGPEGPLLTGAGSLQSSWLFPKARELFRRCRPCTSSRKSGKTPCVHRHQSTKPLPKCSQCVPRKRFFRMLLLAMWPEAKLLRCPWCQRKVFEERSTMCVWRC